MTQSLLGHEKVIHISNCLVLYDHFTCSPTYQISSRQSDLYKKRSVLFPE